MTKVIFTILGIVLFAACFEYILAIAILLFLIGLYIMFTMIF